MSIVTKSGDSGDTSLMYGRRISKTDHRVEAYGTVDELNAVLGVARATAEESQVGPLIRSLQDDLVVVMGELAVAEQDRARYEKDGFKFVGASMIDRLTDQIRLFEKEETARVKGWATPGGSRTSAFLDLARTVCRRAERNVARIEREGGDSSGNIRVYLNRLSDLCWVLARLTDKPKA